MIVDLRDPTAADSVPVEVSAPSRLPADAPQAWELTEGSRLSGEALDAQESTLTAPAEVTGESEGAQLGRAEPVTLTSGPGAVTVLRFEPVGADEPPTSAGR